VHDFVVSRRGNTAGFGSTSSGRFTARSTRRSRRSSDRQAALQAELIAVLQSRDTGGGAGLVVPEEYLETVITK